MENTNVLALQGGHNARIRFFRNSGNANQSVFSEVTGSGNPFHAVDFGFFHVIPECFDVSPVPARVTATHLATLQLDDDGDIDCVISTNNIGRRADVQYYANVGTASQPVYQQQIGAGNPFNGADLGSAPALACFDMDGYAQ